MNSTALRLSPLALTALLAGSVVTTSQAQTTAYTDPVGYYTMTIVGGADNVMSLPMVRDAVFAGTVASGAGTVTSSGFTALAGSSSPGWTASQWVYAQGTQPLTYYVEFTSGALKGLYYKISANTSNVLTLDTEGDDLTNHTLPGTPNGSLAAGDSFKIRPYWRVADVFESGGTPIITPKASALDPNNDSILFPTYADPSNPATTDTNKSANLELYYLTGTGWKAVGQTGTFGDMILRPNEAFVVRRRSSTGVSLTNLGSVLMNRSIYFFSGGNGTRGNDTYFSISRPSEVTLDASGVRIADQNTSALLDTPSSLVAGSYDVLLAFDTPATNAGFNLSAAHSYYYLAGSGWREVGNASTTVGQDVKLEPGKGYILRKRFNNMGRDWVNDPNY